MSASAGGEVVLVDPLSRPDWNALVAHFPASTIFHSANWARVLAESYGFTPNYFALFDGGVLRGCLPLIGVESTLTVSRGVSVSFADNCASLVSSRSDFLRLFVCALEHGRRQGWRFVEFRGEPLLKGEPSCETYMHHEIELSSDEVMQRRLRQSTARNIRKASREGVEVEFSHSLQGVMEYYRLHCMTRRRHGLPPQPRRFFKKLHEQVIAQGLGVTALARYRGATIAGIVCLYFGRNALYKYGASDDAFQNFRANNLLLWETMKRCAQEGYRHFSLGRTEPENEGLLVFKNGWGADAATIDYHRYDLGSDSFRGGEREKTQGYMFIKKVLSRMPIGVLRGIGTVLYKYAG